MMLPFHVLMAMTPAQLGEVESVCRHALRFIGGSIIALALVFAFVCIWLALCNPIPALMIVGTMLGIYGLGWFFVRDIV